MSNGPVNQTLTALPGLIAAERAGRMTPGLESRVIHMARVYARKNKLPFDGTVRGAFRLAEEADRTVREYIDEYNRRQARSRRGGIVAA